MNFITDTRIRALATALLLVSPAAAFAEQSEDSQTPEPVDEEQAYAARAEQFLDSLSPQRGEIALPGGVATLKVPEGFYYLSPEDSKRVLEDAWGNPEDELNLGMLFPSRYTPLDADAWGVTIDYLEEGHISDDNAGDIDYDYLLEEMKTDTRAESEARVQLGYEPIELVGWAVEPFYDETSHKLHWAKELKFGDMEEHTLNYNIRVLGRQGVLVMNFIAGMRQLPEIESGLDEVLAMADFEQGHRYDDFDPDVDKVAAYGLGGLVAGKVLAKTGILAMALLALKKFWFVIAAVGAALVSWLLRRRSSG